MNPWNNVAIEKDGKTVAGKYRVEGGIITVTYDAEGGAAKSTQVGNTPPDSLARALLAELFSESRIGKGGA